MTVSRLQNVHVVGASVERLAEFWQRALGLERRFVDPGRWIQLQAGEDAFAIASPGEGVPAQAGAVPVFEADDLEGHAAAIEEHGGRVLDLRNMGDHGRVLTFSDPDGNIAQLLIRDS